MMMPTEWNIENQALKIASQYGLDERVSINDAYEQQVLVFLSYTSSL